MAHYWQDIWRIIRSDKVSTCRNVDGTVRYIDGINFRGMSLSKHKQVVERITDAQRGALESALGNEKLYSVSDVKKFAAEVVAPLSGYELRGLGSGTKEIRRVVDSLLGGPGIGLPLPGMNMNYAPQFGGMAMPNLWVDPTEAALIYASGGLPALIINKKSKSIEYNGIRIRNSKLSPEQMETVNESMEHTHLARALSDGMRDALTYGGAIVFPMLKKDSPATMWMSIEQLARIDVVGKGCIDHYVTLDRNNAIHIPNWNPTAADFLNPRLYFIPYLGSDVNGQRCGRIVPIPQAGYWGAIMSMGWGVSDIQGWYQAVCNYEGVASAVPTMIKQMSILVRTFNIDLSNALNGATALDDMDIENTLKIREASNENPISMDLIGDLKAVERDFTAVAELTRIVRQDVAVRANMPEEHLWSSDRGAFASGDQTDGINEKQWEGMKYAQSEVKDRCKNLAMLEIINALGKDRDILRALPYTEIEFLPPRIENAEKRATIVNDLAEATFDLVASGMPLDSALDIVLPYGDSHLAPTSEVLGKIRAHERERDAKDKEEHELDMKLKQKQLEAPVAASGLGLKSPSSFASSKKESGYSKLEQRQHEKTRGGGRRKEGIQRMQGKRV